MAQNGKTNGNGAAITLVGDRTGVSKLLESEEFQRSLNTIATKYLTPERVAKVAMLAASRQPKLALCTAASFLQSIVKACEMGLEFGGTTGQGYLVPYKNGWLSKKGGYDVYECQFMPGYQGFIELAYRSGRVSFVDAQLVFGNDTFRLQLGSNPNVLHEPSLADDRGPLVGAYSVVCLTGSDRPKIEFMNCEQLERVRDCSKSKDDGPWVTFPGEMQRKSVLRRGYKYIPKTPEIIAAMEADNADYDLGHTAAQQIVGEIGVNGCKQRLMDRANGRASDVPPLAAAATTANIEEPVPSTPAPEPVPQPPKPAPPKPEPPQDSPIPHPDIVEQPKPAPQPQAPPQEAPEEGAPVATANADGWACSAGHAFPVPKPSSHHSLGICPVCLTNKIRQAVPA